MYIDILKIKRLLAAFIDFMLSAVLAFVLTVFFPGDKYFLYIFFYAFMVFKDILGYSLGKHLMKLTIVDRNGVSPPLYALVLRNIFLIIWMIDVVLILICNKKTCDYWFRTSVIDKKSWYWFRYSLTVNAVHITALVDTS